MTQTDARVDSTFAPSVLVGVDGSRGARAALAWAVRYAAATGAGGAGAVEAVAVYRQPWQTTPIGARPESSYREEASGWLTDATNALRAGAGVSLGTAIVEGHPGEVLTARAKTADVLVLGRGHGLVTGIGSTALHCLRHAAVPVVAVPAA